MTLVLLRALTTRRRVVVDVLIWGLAWLLAPVVELRIPPTTYVVGVAAASLVSSGLLANATFRVDAMQDYAQLPLHPARLNLAFASAAWILLVAEIVVPAALFGLRLGQLAVPDVCAMLVVAACGPLSVALAAGLVALPTTGLLPTRGSAAMRGRAGTNYFLRASLADRVVWINAVGLFAVATVFTVTAWEQGLRFPLALALIAVNSPLVTMISGDPDLARQLTMLGRPALAWWHYAVAVAAFLGTFNAGAGVVYWLLGARDLPLIAGLVVVVTALEALAVPALERHAPLRGLRTRRDAWRHPRKYLLPAALLLALAWIRLG
jgi:terC family integral membrane protein